MTDSPNTSPSREVAELVALADTLGLSEIDLDETVHDLCSQTASQAVNDGAGYEDAHDSASVEASAINNGGLEAQIAFLVSSSGAEWARAHLHSL